MREGSGKHPDHHGLWWQNSGALSLGDGAERGPHTWTLSTEDQADTRRDRSSPPLPFKYLLHAQHSVGEQRS